MSTALDRRTFLKLLGGGIVILVRLRPDDVWAQSRGYPTDLNAYLHIAENGPVTVFSGKIEMGQGVMTSLAQMVAEDLGVGLDALEMVMGHVAHAPLEPHAATAVFEKGKLTVWASTQTPFPTRDRLAQALSLDPEDVRVLTPWPTAPPGTSRGRSRGAPARRHGTVAASPT